jgi:hypothetical protein
VRQGEVYDYSVRGERYRVLVVSTDVHNEVRLPWIVPIRRRAVDAPPYLVALRDQDPVGGSADVDRLDRAPLDGEPVGMITGATMQRVREAIHTLFAA